MLVRGSCPSHSKSEPHHGLQFYIQICPLRSNKLLDKLESTQPSVISLQQNLITMALISAQNVSDTEFFLEKKEAEFTPLLS